MKAKVPKTSCLSFRQGFLPVLYLTLAVSILAQEKFIRFEHISSEQGLSQNVVYSIVQDQMGFMWFGTQNGLNRFDGYIFKVYKNKPNDPLTLPANVTSIVYEDRSGNLWIGTWNGGLSLFNRENETFIRCPYVNGSDPNPGPDIDIILSIYEYRNGILYIGTWGGLLCYDPKKKVVAFWASCGDNRDSNKRRDSGLLHRSHGYHMDRNRQERVERL